MIHDKRSEYVSRDSILGLLSDAEVARVSTAETASSLAKGDEYLDLTNLDRGVQRANGAATVMGTVLPRRAVDLATWGKILSRLEAKPQASTK
jgi:hypothetical protein